VVFQCGEEFFCRPRRIAEALALPLDDSANRAARLIEEANQEVIRVLHLDAETGQRFTREVREVVSHDDIGARLDGSRQDVAVVLVRQGKGRGQFLVAGHEAVADGLVHQGAGPRQALGGKVRIVESLVPVPAGGGL
jgi:hypothetical protein